MATTKTNVLIAWVLVGLVVAPAMGLLVLMSEPGVGVFVWGAVTVICGIFSAFAITDKVGARVVWSFVMSIGIVCLQLAVAFVGCSVLVAVN